MERVDPPVRWVNWAIIGGLLVAPVILPVRAAIGSWTTEAFPESRWGSPPSAPVEGSVARAPAGLIFSDAYAATPQPQLTTDPSVASPSAQGRADMLPRPTLPESPLRRPVDAQKKTDLIPTANRGVQEISVIASDQGYFPRTVFVTQDIPVRMFVTGASNKPLCIMMDTFNVRRQLKAQQIQEITFTPNAPGRYRFYCPVNGMEGIVVVRELASVGSATGVSDPTGIR